MTIREYVSQKLQGFNISEAVLMDVMVSIDMDLEGEYTFDIAGKVGKAIATTIEELILAPRLSNVSEGGFSMSWDFSNLGKYYLFLCHKWGIPVNEDVLTVAGLSAIINRTDFW